MMKPKFQCFQLLPVLAAGLMISPLAAQSPDRPGPPPQAVAPREAPLPDRLQAAVRQMVELHKAGKHEEAQAISQRLRQAAKDNPEVAKQVSEALRNAPQPQVRPNAPDQPQRPQPQVVRPNAPDQPQLQPQRPQRQRVAPEAPQPQVMRPNAPDQPQRPQIQPKAPTAPQPNAKWWSAPVQPPHQMQQPNPAGRPSSLAEAGMRPFQRRLMQPNPGCPPQCPMMGQGRAVQSPFPQMFQRGGQGRGHMGMMGRQFDGQKSPLAQRQSPVVRPRVEAAKQRAAAAGPVPEIAKIRHLKVAAEHLAAAGYTEHAAKAREEIGRMEAALKAAPTPPMPEMRGHKAIKDKAIKDKAIKDKAIKDKAKPAAPATDANAAILAELKKIGKQMGDLSARVRKLEGQSRPDRD